MIIKENIEIIKEVKNFYENNDSSIDLEEKSNKFISSLIDLGVIEYLDCNELNNTDLSFYP